jgi:hypothetical protein
MRQSFHVRQGIFRLFGTEKLTGGQLGQSALELAEHGLFVAASGAGSAALALDDGDRELGLFPKAHQFLIGEELDLAGRAVPCFERGCGKKRKHGISTAGVPAHDQKRKKPGASFRASFRIGSSTALYLNSPCGEISTGEEAVPAGGFFVNTLFSILTARRKKDKPAGTGEQALPRANAVQKKEKQENHA